MICFFITQLDSISHPIQFNFLFSVINIESKLLDFWILSSPPHITYSVIIFIIARCKEISNLGLLKQYWKALDLFLLKLPCRIDVCFPPWCIAFPYNLKRNLLYPGGKCCSIQDGRLHRKQVCRHSILFNRSKFDISSQFYVAYSLILGWSKWKHK